ncbi:MAG: hypothetical protein ACMXYF_05565 [Candidatus Woesearchaeota archaeon]
MNIIGWMVMLIMSLVLATLIFMTLHSFDFLQMQQTVSSLLGGQQQADFVATNETFVAELFKSYQEQKQLGENHTTVIFALQGSGEFNETAFFSQVRSLSLCRTFENQEHSCGSATNVGFDSPYQLPTLAQVTFNFTPDRRFAVVLE